MSYSLKDLCDEIGLKGNQRSLKYIYDHADGPTSLDPENYPLPPLNMWAKVRPGRTLTNPFQYKGIMPYSIRDYSTDIYHLWDRSFEEDSNHLHHFYNAENGAYYRHTMFPAVTVFTCYASNNGAPIYPETDTVYNDVEDAGGATYNHEITCDISLGDVYGTDFKIGLNNILLPGGRFCVYIHPIAGKATHDFFIPNPNVLEHTNGLKYVIDIAGQHWESGTYRVYPYFQNAAGSPFSFPVTPLSGTYGQFKIVDVAEIPYIPMTGVHWEYEWIDLAYPGTPQTGTVKAYMESASLAPTHGLIGFTVATDGTNIVAVDNPQGEVESVVTTVTLKSLASGVAFVKAIGHDKKRGSQTFEDTLKVYTGGRDLVLSPTSLDLRISVAGNETTATIIAKAAPNSSINNYTWTSADSSILSIVSSSKFLDSSDNNWNKSRCVIKGIKPNIPGTPTTLTCNAVEMNRTCLVSVYNPAVGITITLVGTQASPIELEEGETFLLSANVRGLSSNYSVSDSGISWFSWDTNPNLGVSVNSSGLVSALVARSTPVRVTATTNNSKWNEWTTYTAECYFRVIEPWIAVEVGSIIIYDSTHDSLNDSTMTLNKDNVSTWPLSLKIKDTEGRLGTVTNYTITWWTGNPSYATIDLNGVLSLLQLGTTTVYCTVNCYNDRSDPSRVTSSASASFSLKVTSNAAVTGISISPASIKIYSNNANENRSVTATVTPNNPSTNKNIGWYSSNTSIVQFTSGETASSTSGNSVTLSPRVETGSATIYAYSAEDHDIKASCAVTIVKWIYVDSVVITGQSSPYTIYTGNSDAYTHNVTLMATAYGPNRTSPSKEGVTWSIEQSGGLVDTGNEDEHRITIFAKNDTGHVVVKATSIGVDSDGNHKTATFDIYILNPTASIQFTQGFFNYTPGESKALTYYTVPANASVADINFSILEDPNNVIRDLGPVSGTVTASSTNTGIAIVTLSAKVNNITVEPVTCLVVVQ